MYSTGNVSNLLEQCDSTEELKENILPLLRDQRTQWREQFARILEDTGLSGYEMARLCEVSETTVRKWRGGALPQNRDMFLRIGFAAGYGYGQMDAFLRRCGRWPGLHVRNLADSVCIFVLSSGTVPCTYASYAHVLALVRDSLSAAIGTTEEEKQTFSTQQLLNQMTEMRDMPQVLDFVRENVSEFSQSYRRFYAYVMAFLNENLAYGEELSRGERRRSFHEIAQESGWSSSLRHCLYEIRRKEWFPQRMKVISLGLHLNMDVQSINDMLRLARMEPLYARNPVEACVIWAVTDYMLNSEEGHIVRDGSNDLCTYVKQILTLMELAESECFLDDL